jgi:hypothetical protein
LRLPSQIAELVRVAINNFLLLFCEWNKNKPADRAVYFSKLTTCGEKETVDGRGRAFDATRLLWRGP